MYLIDTNICIYIMNNHPKEVMLKCRAAGVGNVCVSSITTSELFYGVSKSKRQSENRKRVEEFLRPFTLLQYDEHCAPFYGDIRATLETQGKIIGSLDMLIAAHALREEAILVTNNTKEFCRIESLQLENWVTFQ